MHVACTILVININLDFSKLCTQYFPSYDNFSADDLRIICQKIENLYNWMANLWLKVENIVAKEKIARLEHFFFLSCHYVFKKRSAAEASESVYMRERVKRTILMYLNQCIHRYVSDTSAAHNLWKHCSKRTDCL